jgi:hypothetical protein
MTYEKLGDSAAAHRYFGLEQQLIHPQRRQ